jgi:hypothetical protein
MADKLPESRRSGCRQPARHDFHRASTPTADNARNCDEPASQLVIFDKVCSRTIPCSH